MSNRPKEMKISLIDDEYNDVEETTRRAAAPRIDSAISFAPTSSTVEPKQALNTAQSLGIERTTRARPIEWELAGVPQLPEFHPLEPTAVFINNASPRDISSRISRVLRGRSIEAVYENSKAKVKCVSSDGVDFRIRLYRGRGDYSTGIIVEVQRRFGTSLTFHQDARAILDAVQGITPSPPPPSFGYSSIPLVPDDDDFVVDGAASLTFVTKLLGTNVDSRYLAFQALSTLTDASKIGKKTAFAVSKELLTPGNAVGGVLFEHVLSEESDDLYHLRALAMAILANAVVAVAGDIDQSLCKHIRPALVRALHRADKSPRVAQLACVILEYLAQHDKDATVFDALEIARSSGMAHHAGLEQQALQCIMKLGG